MNTNMNNFEKIIITTTINEPAEATLKFFSQNGQDYFLENNIFRKIKNGVFVDIGANDGKTFSNTYFFEKKGWTGICVEPIKDVFEKLEKNRVCKCIHGVISGNDEEFANFFHIPGDLEMLSGILEKYDEKHLERLKREGVEGGEIISIKNYNFNNIITTNDIDYLSIDTEGSEFDILESIDFSKYTIKVISIENDYNDKRINNFLKEKEFQYLKTIGSDDIYLNKKYKKLIEKKFLYFKLFLFKIYKNIKLIIKKIINKDA